MKTKHTAMFYEKWIKYNDLTLREISIRMTKENGRAIKPNEVIKALMDANFDAYDLKNVKRLLFILKNKGE